MAIEIIGKVKQKNNGNFKLVDLADVDYDGSGKNAKEELERQINDVRNNSTPYDDTEIKQNITNIQNELGTEELTTTAKNIKAAINENSSQIKETTKKTTDSNIFYSRIGGNIQSIIDNMIDGQMLIIDIPVTVDYTITIDKNIDFICNELIRFNNVSGLKIAPTSKLEKRKFVINIANNNDQWSSNTIGLELGKVYNSKIEINYVHGFSVGVKMCPDATGCVYNNIFINYISDCRISLMLSNINGGWTNENYFYGGFRLITSSNTDQSLSRIGILITSDDGNYKNNNSNLFNKPCFEMGSTKISESYCVKIEHGILNKFINCRYENEQQFAKIENQSTDNEFSFNYCKYSPVIEEPKGIHSNRLNNRNLTLSFKNIFNFNFNYNICEYNDTTFSVKNASLYAVGSDYFNEVKNIAITKSNDYYVMNGVSKIGVKIDTSKVKKFKVKSNCENGYGGRVIIKTFDVNGNPINANNNQVSIIGNFLTSGNGIFQTTTDSDDGTYKTFYVDDTVYSIIIALSGGTNELRIKGFSIFAETELDTNIIIDGIYSKNLIVNNRIPTTGNFRENEIIYNSNTSTGKTICWIYNNNEWKPIGTY